MSTITHPPSQAAHIIRKFSGVRPMARALSAVLEPGLDGRRREVCPTTVQRWKSCGYIPVPQWGLVVDAAAEAGVALEPADFTAHLAERFERLRKRGPTPKSVVTKELEGAA